MLHNLVIAASGVIALVMGWVVVQSMVRRTSPHMDDGTDVLQCGLCSEGGCFCGLRRDHRGAVSSPVKGEPENE